MELRNDDIILSGDAESSVMSAATEEIDDTSSPYVNPYYIDTDTSAGGAGTPIPSVQPVDPSDTIPEATTTTVTVTDTIIIDNYDPVYLQSLDQDGYTFYAVYDDNTVEEVDWTEVTPVDFDESIVINLEGLAVAEAINQHFWSDTNGVHVTADAQTDWKAAVEAGFDDLSANKNYYNSLFNSLGLLFRRALFNLVAVTKEGIAFYDGVGNEPEDIMSFFGRYQAQIGRSNSKHVVIDNDGITAYNGDGTVAPLNAANITAAEANIQQLQTNTADIGTIRANSAKVENLTAQELSAATAYIDTLNTNSVTTDILRAASAYIQNLLSENITANVLAADHAAIGTLDVNYARVDAANIQNETVRNSWIDQLMVQTGLLANEGTVFTLDAIQVNAANITAGTIDVDRLIVTVDGEKYLVHVDPTTLYPTYQKLDGGVIEDLTITADKLVAGSVTAEKITAENLVGTGGWINLASGTFAYANAQTGDGISWDGQHLQIGAGATLAGMPVEDICNAANQVVYDHTYTYDPATEIYAFTATVTKGGIDVTNQCSDEFFVWYLKNEQNTTFLGTGKSMNVSASSAIFTGTVLGALEEHRDYTLVDDSDAVILTDEGDSLYVRSLREV